MKKIFVMFATVAAFTLASCGGADKQKATENAADTAPAVAEPAKEEAKPAGEVKADSAAKKEGVQEAPKEGAEMKKEEAKPAEVKKEEVKK